MMPLSDKGRSLALLAAVLPQQISYNHFISRIPIHERVELPEHWIPADSRVEIDAKITAGETLPANPTHFWLVYALHD